MALGMGKWGICPDPPTFLGLPASEGPPNIVKTKKLVTTCKWVEIAQITGKIFKKSFAFQIVKTKKKSQGEIRQIIHQYELNKFNYNKTEPKPREVEENEKGLFPAVELIG